jgi:hypothetical protein
LVFLALIVALAAVGVLADLSRRPFGVKKSTRCPNCQTPMSMRRVAFFQSFSFKGVWMWPALWGNYGCWGPFEKLVPPHLGIPLKQGQDRDAGG